LQKSRKNKDDGISRISVALPKDVHEMVLEMAKEHDLSVAWVVRYIVTNFLKNNRKIALTTKEEK